MNRVFSLTVAILCGAAFFVIADDANGQLIRRRVVPLIQQPQTMTGQHDVFLADWIAADNQIEITLNQFASPRLSSQEVKDFAQEMIRAHSDLANKLNQAVAANAATAPTNGPVLHTAGYRGVQETAPANPGTAPANPGTAPASPGTAPQPESPPTLVPRPARRPHRHRRRAPAANGPGAPIPAPANPAQHGVPQTTPRAAGSQSGAAASIPAGASASTAPISGMSPLGFKREVNGEFVTLIEQKLDQEKGQDFDRCFVQGQIVGHIHMLATLEVARKQASPQLKPLLDEAVSVAQKHLSQAESLLGKLRTESR